MSAVMKRAFVSAIALCALAGPAAAHQFAPALLELEEAGGDMVDVRWKQPAVRVQGSRLRPVLPVECQGEGNPTVQLEGSGMRATWQIRCPGGLGGKVVGVEGIATSQADVLLRIGLRDGRKLRAVLKANAPSYEIRAGNGRAGVFRDYLALGVKHILTGWDHLAFVLALLLLVGWGRRLLVTITAFTAGHSVTLALAALGVVRVPQQPMEAAIALSIFFLAVELTRRRPEGQRPTLAQRAPWLVAGTFGLLHGLGFAGALSEVGLPAAEIPLSLFAFNLGIELGQLGFISVALGVGAVIAWSPLKRARFAAAVPPYAIGVVSVFWFIERVVAAVAPRMIAPGG